MSSLLKKKEISLSITAIIVVVMMIDFFTANQNPIFSNISGEAQTWAIIITAFAVGLGFINIFAVHGKKVQRRTEGQWVYSLWVLIIMIVMIVFGLADLQSMNNPVFVFIRDNLYLSLFSAVYGLTGFYITTAIYRSYRTRTWEAAVLLVVGAIMILKEAPIGELYLGTGLITLGSWLMDVVNMAGQRGLMIAVGIGIILITARILLGMEGGIGGS